VRKLLFGLVAAAAIASPIALASSASAATTGTGTMHFVTHYQGVDYVHDATTAYTCDADGNVDFEFTGNDPAWTGNGSGTITATMVEFSGHRDADGYSYTGAGNLTGEPNSAWLLTASTDSMGQVGASADGYFAGVPDCKVEAPVAKGNHGEYVSGAAHAGVKGKALAAIAKDVTLVGPYKG
jgi:hypothetical protein